jgi:mycothiol synthase
VSHLAVDRAHRRRGVAQQLLADAYAAARERGVSDAGLSTDTRTGALDLYVRLGMRVKFTLDNWRRPL